MSSRRRRQRRIAELVTLVEQLEQYLTILRAESATLQNDIHALGDFLSVWVMISSKELHNCLQ